MQDQPSTTIAILGGNTVVGGAISLLLGGLGYETRTLEAPPKGPVADLLGDIDLLLVAPGLDDGRRGESLALLKSAPNGPPVPVLVLTSATDGSSAEGGARAPWPVGIERLAREIEAVLDAARTEARSPCRDATA